MFTKCSVNLQTVLNKFQQTLDGRKLDFLVFLVGEKVKSIDHKLLNVITFG